MTSAVVLLWLSLAGSTEGTPPPADAPAATAPSSAVTDPPITRWGAQLDAGAPDALGVAAVFRPFYWLRFNGGLVTNTAAWGLRAGVSLAPFYFPLTPTLSLDVGRMFNADYRPLARKAGLDSAEADPLLRDFGYTFANAHLGIEVGSARRFVFFLRGGLSYWSLHVPNFDEFLQNATDDSTVTGRIKFLHATTPSAKLGFTFYFR